MKIERLKNVLSASLIVASATYLSTFLTYSQKSSIAILSLVTLFAAIRFHNIAAVLTLFIGLLIVHQQSGEMNLRNFFFETVPVIGLLAALIILSKKREDGFHRTEALLEEERRDKFLITEQLARELKNASHVLNIGAQYLKTNGNEFEKFDKAVEILTSKSEMLDQTLERIISVSEEAQGKNIRINPLPCSLKKILLSSLPASSQIDFKSTSTDSLWDESELQKAFSIIFAASNTLGLPQISFSEKKDHAKVSFAVKELLTPSELQGLNVPFHSEVQKKFNNALIGLDLNLARGIIESHGGNLKVFSTVHEGTIFTILLPKKME